ncbi:MAG TPA: hypothetical protein VN764_09120 [Polyangiaceae bacterium]|nr:hypothetical protein [Polyangiaceae bacterium]
MISLQSSPRDPAATRSPLSATGFLLLSALLLGACGGPLSHTVKLSLVPEGKRDEVSDEKLKSNDAALHRDQMRHAVTEAESDVKAAKLAIKEREGDVGIAKAKLDMEKAKTDANRNGDATSAETELHNAKVKRDVAKAQLDLDEEELALAEAKADEAKAAWLLSLAEYENAKAERVESKDANWSKKKGKVTEQLSQKKAEQGEAQGRVEKATARVDKAKARLADAADQ